MKRTPGSTPAAKEKYWTKIIEEARQYPQGVTEYCRVMNVEKGNYYTWFRRLRKKHPEWYDLANHPEPLASNQATKTRRGRPIPETEVVSEPRRRKWGKADRERVLEVTDGLSGPELSAALRREGLYVHTLNKWRTERDLANIATKSRDGTNPLMSENKKLKEQNARLQKKLEQANEIIQLQKKISQMLTLALDNNDDQ